MTRISRSEIAVLFKVSDRTPSRWASHHRGFPPRSRRGLSRLRGPELPSTSTTGRQWWSGPSPPAGHRTIEPRPSLSPGDRHAVQAANYKIANERRPINWGEPLPTSEDRPDVAATPCNTASAQFECPKDKATGTGLGSEPAPNHATEALATGWKSGNGRATRSSTPRSTSARHRPTRFSQRPRNSTS